MKFIITLLLSIASINLCVQAQAADPKRPNILLIMADDMGIETLGSYGGTTYPTPNLDALAESGMRFNHCHSNPKCSPSRVNLMTGRYGFRTGQDWGVLPKDEITFGSVLRDAGYATALAGKWQMNLLGDNPRYPIQQGFEKYIAWAWHEGPRYWDPLIWENGKLRENAPHETYGPDIYKQFLIDFMAKEKDKGPFFAYYPMCLTHFPKKGGPYIEPVGPNGKYQTYAEMMAHTDRIVGELINALDELGIRENTLVLFTGDNGTPDVVISERNGESIRGGKGLHTDIGTHVPLIASWPGTTPQGTTNDSLIDFSDFMTTFAEMGNAKLPQDRSLDGVSFLPQLKGEKGTPREWIYTEYQGLAWIRNHRWKYYSDDRFFDMQANPKEDEGLNMKITSEEALEARNKLAKEMKKLHSTK